jgi:hypothetical protein
MLYRFRTLEWPDIVQFYDDLVNKHSWPYQPMAALVRHLASSQYASSLFPCTSHDLLRVGRVRDFAPSDNELQIQFDGVSRRFTFRYVQREDDLRPWSRECEETEWEPVLHRILHKRLNWFHEG